MKVQWTNRALEHLLNIYEYIAQDSPMYAKRTMDRLTARSMQIGDLPRSGRKVPEYDSPDVREIIEGNYRLIYQIKEFHIDVLAVVHTRQSFKNQ